MVKRKRKCPNCGRGLNESWLYCPMCGQKYKEGDEDERLRDLRK